MSRKKKPQPVPRGQYEPWPFFAILSPDGKFYRAGEWQHEAVAKDVTGEDWQACLDKGWLRIADCRVWYAFDDGDPTQAQIDALDDLATTIGFRLVDLFDRHDKKQAARFLGVAL